MKFRAASALLRAAALGLLLALAAACEIGEPLGVAGQARARFVHAARDAGPVTVRWSGADVFAAVPYGAAGAAGEYAAVAAGPARLAVRTGSDTLVAGTINTAPLAAYTLALVRDSIGHTVVVLADAPAEPPGAAARVRVVQLSPTVAALGRPDLYLVSQGAALVDAAAAAPRLAYGASHTFLAAPGTYALRFTAAGSRDAAVDAGAVALAAGQVRTVLVLDPEAPGGPVRALVLADRN